MIGCQSVMWAKRKFILAVCGMAGVLAAAWLVTGADAKEDPGIWEGPQAFFAPDVFPAAGREPPVLRVLTVDERTGHARKREMVRVPVFFHRSEAVADVNGYVLMEMGGGKAIAYQADDVRRDASGKIARMHLYFVLDELPAWGRRQFELRKGRNAGAELKPMEVKAAGGRVAVSGRDLRISFHAAGPRAGAIASIQGSMGDVHLPDGYVGPAAELIRQPLAGDEPLRKNRFDYRMPASLTVRSVRWGAGPIFSKVAVQVSPATAPNDVAEYVYQILAEGTVLCQVQRLFPGDDRLSLATVGATADNHLLAGRIRLGKGPQEVVKVPAGLRREFRSVFHNFVPALVNRAEGISMSVVPYVHQGVRDIQMGKDEVLVEGSGDFQTKKGSNSGGLRVFFGEVRFAFSKEVEGEDLWKQNCRLAQPLTAVVDEPWASVDDLKRLAVPLNEKFFKIPHWRPGPETRLAMEWFRGRKVGTIGGDSSHGKPNLGEVLPSLEENEEAWKKHQGPGELDPYHITYGTSAVVPFAAFVNDHVSLNQAAYRLGQGSRLVLGQATPEGWPNIRNFANAANMKVGPFLCAMWGGAKLGDRDLLQWGRDAATSQNLLATYGHGQRPYNMSSGVREPSDLVYIAVTDFWLRVAELACNEDLSIHPSVYGRYFDMVDVNADLYQGWPGPEDPDGGRRRSWWRAAFLRGQAHDHRWEAFACDPYLGALAKADDRGRVGITESCYYMHYTADRAVSWNQVMTHAFFPVVAITEGLSAYRPAKRPAMPGNLRVSREGRVAKLRWEAVPGAAGYRVYRAARRGGPWTWLNSPYAGAKPVELPTAAAKRRWKEEGKTPEIRWPALPDKLVKVNHYEDRGGAEGDLYFVTAEDSQGRESRWFPDEPLPPASK